MNVAKFDIKAIGHVCAHFERTPAPGHYSNKNIDPKRTINNYNLGPERDCSQVEYIKQSLNNISHLNRDNLTVMASIIVTKPKNIKKEQQEEYFQNTYEYLKARYCRAFDNPEDGVISCYVHLDEKTPHMHFAFLPVIKKKMKSGEIKQRFCSKELINRDDLRTLHQDLEKYINTECKLRCKILTGTTKRHSNGRAYTYKELQRESNIKRNYNRSYNGG